MLDLTRIESGQLRFSFEEVDLREVVDQACQSLIARCEDASVNINLNQSSERLTVQADAKRFRMVIANIMDNSLKYSPTGGTIQVELGKRVFDDTEGSLKQTKWAFCAISDEGPGIPTDYQSGIFEKFFRVEDHVELDKNRWKRAGPSSENTSSEVASQKGVRGTGIGLYLAKKIIIGHGGKLWCETPASGRGAQLNILLPL